MTETAAVTPSFRERLRSIARLNQLGPGLITGAADDDPSGIATYSQGGAQFGFGLLWTLVLTFPLMVAIQLVSAHIGRVTGRGLAKNMTEVMPHWLVTALVALLFLANTINVGADLAAMGEAAKLVAGFGQHEFTIGFAIVSVLLQMFVSYKRYARFLTVLTLSLFAYVAVVFMIHLDWSAVGLGMIGIHANLSSAAATTIVAIFGTTISPYLFFWQSAEEVEELNHHSEEKPLTEAPDEAPSAFSRMRVDTIAGMAVSNLVALAIMISTAATLHAAGKTDIQTAAQAAQALQPLAGKFAFLLFSLGIIGTGMLAIPVLAGSAAYAVSETSRLESRAGQHALASQGLLHRDRRGGRARPDDRLFRIRSDQGALLERGRQRRHRGADDGGDDVRREQSQKDGRVHGRPHAFDPGLGIDAGDGGGGGNDDICGPDMNGSAPCPFSAGYSSG